MKKISVFLCELFLLLVTMSSANAGLTTIGTAQFGGAGVGYNLIWDNNDNLIWLDYTNPPAIWESQMFWVSGIGSDLTYNIDSAYNLTWDTTDSWSLGSISELWILDEEIDRNPAYANNFINLKRDGHYYWSSSEIASIIPGNPPNQYWIKSFILSGGGQGNGFIYNSYCGLAVRSGQVSTASVPEPATMLLLGIGMIGLAGARRKLKK